MPKSISSTVTSIDATQRKLIVGIVIATLMALAIVIADLAIGGRPDPPALRTAATLLDGGWQFHTGDDPHWADANTDDNGWETVDMTALPGSHDGECQERRDDDADNQFPLCRVDRGHCRCNHMECLNRVRLT